MGFASKVPTINDNLKALIGLTMDPWEKTIWIGASKGIESLEQELRQDGCILGEWAIDYMKRPDFCLASRATRIVLGRVLAGRLALTHTVSYGEIFTRLRRSSFPECPQEVGARLPLWIHDQRQLKIGRSWHVAMKPLVSGTFRGILSVQRDMHGCLALRWIEVPNDDLPLFNRKQEFVFARAVYPENAP